MAAARPQPTTPVELIRAALATRADPVRAAQQQRYMKSAMPFRGLTAPQLRATVRRVLVDVGWRPPTGDRWEATIRELWDNAGYREERYAALVIARHPSARHFRAAGALALYRHLIVTGAWWDLVDEVATHLVRDELLARPAEVAPLIRGWATDADLWIRRSAIISQVGARHLIDLGLLADVITPNLEGAISAGPTGRQDFFIRKAIGWALRDASYRNPAWVGGFVENHADQMAGLTVREAIKQITRSSARGGG